MSEKVQVAKSSAIAGGMMALLKLAAGFLSGSLALISEGIHSTIDFGVTLATWFSVKTADIPADREHHYGHGKIENLTLSQSACPLADEKAKATGPSESVVVDAKAVIGRTVAGKLKGQAAVLEVSQMQNNQVVGGLTIVVLDEKAVKQ